MSVQPLFTLMGQPIYGFSLTILIGAAAALIMASKGMKRAGFKAGVTETLALLLIPLSVLGARLLYCILRMDYWLNDAGIGFFFRLWEGGFVLYGALAGGLAACWAAGRITRTKPLSLADAIVPGVMLMIAFARFGEGFCQEGFGWETDMSPLFPYFPIGIYESYYEVWYWPLFLLEATYALAASIHLYHTWQHKRCGDQTMRFLLIYACGQIVFESMRRDSVLRFGFVRWSQLFSALAVAAVLIVYGSQLPREKRKRALLPAWAVVILMAGIVVLMEFALEKKILFLEWMDTAACYLVMSGAAAAMYLMVRRVGRMRD